MCEYHNRFTQLSRYAPKEVDSDAKKQKRFLKGRNDGLQQIVSLFLASARSRHVAESSPELIVCPAALPDVVDPPSTARTP